MRATLKGHAIHAARVVVGAIAMVAPTAIGIWVPNEIIGICVVALLLVAVAYMVGWSILSGFGRDKE